MMMMMSASTALESATASSKWKENLWYWVGQWPSTGIFNMLVVSNLALLLTMGLLSRGLGISAARIFSDYPDWNHAKQYDVAIDPKTGNEQPIDPKTAEINRRRNFLERIFIEFVGTILASYVFLQTSQDITAKILETAFKDKLKPENLLNAAKELEGKYSLNPDQIAKFETILKSAFGRDDKFKGMGLDDAKHVVYSKIYGKGNLHSIAEGLAATGEKALSNLLIMNKGGVDLEKSRLGKEFEAQWGLLNPLGVFTVLVGAVGSAWLSGAPVQWANDTLFRDKGMPAILGWWDKLSPVDNAVKKRQQKYHHPLVTVTHSTVTPLQKPLNVVSTASPVAGTYPQSFTLDAQSTTSDDAKPSVDGVITLPTDQALLRPPLFHQNRATTMMKLNGGVSL